MNVSQVAAQTSEAVTGTWALRRHPSLSAMILVGLLAGAACGIVFGDYCAWLDVVGRAFIGLLRMTVLPYIVVALVASFGRLSLSQTGRLAWVGGLTTLALWAVSLVSVFLLAQCFPHWQAGSFFSTSSVTEPVARADLLDLFIPANFFAALAENRVPAVVVLCIFAGLALASMKDRQIFIAQLDLIARMLVRVSVFVTRLAPIGLFAVAASTAGTMSLAEFGRLQAYLVAYAGGAAFLALVVLPWLVTVCTPFTYRDVIGVARDALITAFVTGKLIIVLPMLIEHTERLFARLENEPRGGAAPAVDMLYPIAYPFPHAGKLLGLLFIPFAAWFLGHAMHWTEYPGFLAMGLFSYFGGPLLATPFLLDHMHLPHDMLQLFLVSGVLGERLGDATGVMHLVAFTLLTACGLTGHLRLRWQSLAKFVGLVTVWGGLLVVGMRAGLRSALPWIESKEKIIDRMQLLDQPIPSEVLQTAAPNPDPLRPGESLLERIRRRGVIRIGFNPDKLPFAYFNRFGTLVGFDISMAHQLARDLGVRIEFVPFQPPTLVDQLAADHCDIVMSGLVGTLERAEAMQHTRPYMDLTLALVVPDHRVRSFKSQAWMRQSSGLRLGFVDVSRMLVDHMRSRLPHAEFVELESNREFFESAGDSLDGLLISAESGSAFTLLYPQYEVVVPDGPRVSLPLFYAIGGRDTELRDFVEHWVSLRQKDGTLQGNYDHWILGKSAQLAQPRWCVIRDVLGWVE